MEKAAFWLLLICFQLGEGCNKGSNELPIEGSGLAPGFQAASGGSGHPGLAPGFQAASGGSGHPGLAPGFQAPSEESGHPGLAPEFQATPQPQVATFRPPSCEDQFGKTRGVGIGYH